jgi:hypothetical protein
MERKIEGGVQVFVDNIFASLEPQFGKRGPPLPQYSNPIGRYPCKQKLDTSPWQKNGIPAQISIWLDLIGIIDPPQSLKLCSFGQ